MYYYISKSKVIKNILLVFVSIILINYFLIFIYKDSIFDFPSLGMTTMSFSIICMSVLNFHTMLKKPSLKTLFKDSIFWYNSGNLIFYCSTFFVYGFFYYQKNPQWGYVLILVSNLLLYTSYSLSLYWDYIEYKSERKLVT
jgi:hypothetical protein